MDIIQSFPPIVTKSTNTLILGTMPGAMSLQKVEYYGYPQNQFWRIMFTVYGTLPVPAGFEARVNLIKRHDIGLWDVLQFCERKGSLDSKIKNPIVNDIPSLLNRYPSINKILFNGKESRKYFTKSFDDIADIEFLTMPSTSPAYTLKFDEKLKLWTDALLS